NRTLFRDRAEQAILSARREGSNATVMFLDIDHFKEINDTLGHEAGDLLLTALADRLRDQMRANETLARLGGDEFGILCAGSASDAGRSSRRSSSCTSSQRPSWRAAASSEWRRSCAGSTPSAGSSRPETSSRSPSAPD